MDYYQKVESFLPTNNLCSTISARSFKNTCDWKKYGDIVLTRDLKSLFVCSTCGDDGGGGKDTATAGDPFVTSEVTIFWQHVKKSHSATYEACLQSCSSNSVNVPEPLAKKLKMSCNIIVIDDDDNDDEQDPKVLESKNNVAAVPNCKEKVDSVFDENVPKNKLQNPKTDTNNCESVTINDGEDDIIMDCKVEPELMSTQRTIAIKTQEGKVEIIEIDDDDDTESESKTADITQDVVKPTLSIEPPIEQLPPANKAEKAYKAEESNKIELSFNCFTQVLDNLKNEEMVDLNKVINEASQQEIEIAKGIAVHDQFDDSSGMKTEDLLSILKERTLEEYLAYIDGAYELSDNEEEEEEEDEDEVEENERCSLPASSASAELDKPQYTRLSTDSETHLDTLQSFVMEHMRGQQDKTASENAEPALLCAYCPRRFHADWQKKRHELIHSRILVQSNTNELPTVTKRILPFKCNTCGRRTSSKKAMHTHWRRFHGGTIGDDTIECETCKKVVLKKHFVKHILTHSTDRLHCPHCPRTYKHRQSLGIHIKRFHPESAEGANNRNGASNQVGDTRASLSAEEHAVMLAYFMHVQSKMQERGIMNNVTNAEVPGPTVPSEPSLYDEQMQLSESVAYGTLF